MFLRLALCLCALSLSVSLFGQTLTSEVDRNQVSANQTLKLTIVYDGSTRTDALDLTAIQQDFDVLQYLPQSSDIQVNNRRVQRTIWTLTLMPKRTGNLVIPSFNLGNIFSEAIQIEVLEPGDLSESDDPLIVELSIDRNNVSVGEQALITVKLRAQSMLLDLAGEQLKLEGAEVRLVHEQEYNEVQNGTNWRVLEWTYAVFPQASGSIAIPRQMFTAVDTSNSQRSFLGGFSSRGQRIASRSEPEILTVEPPEEPGSDWFPASQVTLSSSWTSDPNNLKVGEPLTRIIEITAESQLAEAIPPLESGTPTNYKEYLDQPVLENTQDGLGITGTRRQSAAIVPSQEGMIEFPEQIIRWWDINADQWREAILPAERYQVSPAILDQSFSPPQNFETTPVLNLDSGSTAPGMNAPESSGVVDSIWKSSTIALTLIVLAQAILLIRGRSSGPTPRAVKPSEHLTTEPEKHAWNELSQALKSANPARIRNSLLAWSKARWPQEGVHSLEMLASRSSSEDFKTAILDLELILFKGASARVSTEALSKELKKLRDFETNQQPESALAPLYPQSL